jgi:hypothetical protein
MDAVGINLIRQLEDIISWAEHLKYSGNIESDIQKFSKFNEELKALLLQNYANPVLHQMVSIIPVINYEAYKPKGWHLLLPSKFYLTAQSNTIEQCLNDVEHAKRVYNALLTFVEDGG